MSCVALCAALAAVLAAGGAAMPAATSGLVAAYSFDAGSGTTVVDSSGNNNVGTISGATWSTTGKYGGALSFDANRQTYVGVPDSASLDLGTAMTLEAWVNPSSVTGSWRTVIFKQRSGGTAYSLYGNDGQDRPVGQVYTTAEQNSRAGSQLVANTWTHLATTYDGSALKLYVNGVEVANVAVSGPIAASSGPLTIGGNAVWSEWFAGLIDDVRIYNRALAPGEIATDMSTPVDRDAASQPAVQLTAPAAGSTVAGAVTVSATASSGTGVAGVQFKLDGQNLGAEDVAAPYSISWDTRSAANGSHTLTAVARDSSGNSSTSAAVGVNVANPAGTSLVLETLITGLAEPTQLVFTPDGRMLVLERSGTVLVVEPGASQPESTPLLQLSSVNTSDERGALGIVLDPGFATNGFFYVLYTHSSLVNRVSRFTAVGNSGSPGSERVIWQNDVAAAIYHQGGGLAFGADGYLYVSIGDNLTPSSAQSLTSYNGKILRIAGDGTVPADNPFNDGAGPNKDAIWALGFRNPFRISFDQPTGRLLVGDVGEGTKEEVDIAVRGANYGWPTCEGVCGAAGMTNPIYAYDHNGRDASITGGVVYRGTQLGAGFDGSYFYGDYAQNWIKRLTFGAGGAVTGSESFIPADGSAGGPYGNPVNIAEGPDGAIYYVDIGALDVANSGTIRRVRNVSGTGNRPPSVFASVSPTSGKPPLTATFSSAGTVDPDGDALTYSWDFGDGATSAQPNPVHTYGASGAYTARLRVSDGTDTASSAPITIRVGTPPVPAISAPAGGSTFRAGQVIAFSGSATDAEDGGLSGSSLGWTIVFHHETHEHPGPGPFTGSSGSFTVPASGHDFTGNTSYEIVLTATDSSGLSSSTSVLVYPQKVNVTFASIPSGLTVVVDSLAHTTPYTFDSLVGFQHDVDVPSPQVSGGSSYAFASWSDGGARGHTVTVPSVDRTYTASFAAAAPPGPVAAYGFEEGAGTAVHDASGNGNAGTVAQGEWTAAGRHGGALSFDGTMVTVPDSPSLDLTDGMTLEAWVNPSAVGDGWECVIFKERPDGMLYSLYAADRSQHPVGQVFLANAEQNAAGPASIPANVWTHLAATYDGSSLRLYVNGSPAGTLAISGSLASTTNPLRIGGNSIWDEFFAGTIDDVRIYDRALSAGEIQTDMATAVGS
jgi:glucose/arabinose dehydrogenase